MPKTTAPDFIPDDQAPTFFGSTATTPSKGAAPDFIADTEADSFFNPAPTDEKNFRFDVAPTTEDRTAKIARLKQEADASAATAKKENSPLGFLKNVGIALRDNITSAGKVGETLGQSLAAPAVTEQLTKSNAAATDVRVNLLKTIREKKANGEDTSRLERAYNNLADTTAGSDSKLHEILPVLDKSTLEVLGELGGTALDVLSAGTYGAAAKGAKTFALLPGKTSAIRAVGSVVPEVGKVAETAANATKGLFTAKGAGNVVKGAGVGYGYDVTQGLQGNRGEDRTGAAALIPGMGTILGGGLPLVTEAIAGIKNARSIPRVIENRTKALSKVEGSRVGVRNYVAKQAEKGFNPTADIAATDLLKGAVDNTGTIRTRQEGGAVQVYNDFIKPFESVVSDAIKAEDNTVPLSEVEKNLTDAVNASGMKGASRTNALAQVRKEIEGYKLDVRPDGTLPVSVIHDAKVDKYSNVNYLNENGRLDKLIAKKLKELVETHTHSADVKALNKEMARHYANIGYLEKLDGTKVEGGRIGKHFATLFGGLVGSHFGPLGAIVGAEVANRAKGAQMAGAFKGKTGGTPKMSDLMVNTKNGSALKSVFKKIKVQDKPTAFTNDLPTIDAGATPTSKFKKGSRKLPTIR